MGPTNVKLEDKIVDDWTQANTQQDGESRVFNRPDWATMFSGNGYIDPTQKAAAFDAIKQNDPGFFKKQMDSYKTFGAGASSVTGDTANDTLNFVSGASDKGFLGGDFSAPAMMIASFGIGAAAPAMGISNVEAALAKAGLSTVMGGNPVTSLANGGLSYLTSTFTGGAESGAQVESPSEGLIGTGNPNVYAANETGTMNDAGPQTGGGEPQQIDTSGAPDTGSGAGSAETIQAENLFSGLNADQSTFGKIIDWANANKGGAGLIAGLGAGALGVAGGVGSALLNKSAAESKIQADRQLLQDKAAQDRALLDYKRGLIQSGSYFDSKGTPTAAPRAPLRRPDGSLVFAQPGLLTGR